jgi:glycosyltransferase involved in cell wall biosynthesis
MNTHFLTIFTPVYNRKNLIKNLYESLKKQKDKDFEWLVIDDGSTDGVRDFFSEIIKKEKEFEIKYYYQDNSGKHVAINKAIDFAKGTMFFIVDSDDVLPQNSIEIIKKWEQTIHNKNEFGGLSGLRGFAEGGINGTTFNGTYLDITTLQQKNFGIAGDRAEVFYTNIIKKYRFPVFEDEKFLTEKVLWNQLANDGYVLRFFNEIIYIGNYLDDGLTKNLKKIQEESPKGYAYSVLQDIVFLNLEGKDKQYSYYYYYEDVKRTVSIKCAAEYLHISSFYLRNIVYKFRVKNFLKSLL